MNGRKSIMVLCMLVAACFGASGCRQIEHHNWYKVHRDLRLTARDSRVRELGELLMTDLPLKKEKQKALLELAEIGTEEAIETIATFDRWTLTRVDRPEIFYFQSAYEEPPLPHIHGGRPVMKFVTDDSEGHAWALVERRVGGHMELAITRQLVRGYDLWSPPQLLGIELDKCPDATLGAVAVKADGLRVTEDSFFLDFRNKTYELDVDVPMHTACRVPELAEGSSRELLAERASMMEGVSSAQAELFRIRQAVFTYMFGTTLSRQPLYMIKPDLAKLRQGDADKLKQQLTFIDDQGEKRQLPLAALDFTSQRYFGYLGPLVVKEKAVVGGANVCGIRVRQTSLTEAEAYYSDYTGPLCAAGFSLSLKKIHGRWVVTKCEMKWIS